MRKQPEIEPPNITVIARQQPARTIREERHYKLITPLFGGGAEKHECDEVTIIRATEIRGMLRFWWRACRGGQFSDNLKAMKAIEDAIWGSASNQKDSEEDSHEAVTTALRYYETIQIEVEVLEPEKIKAIPYPFYNQSQQVPGAKKPKSLFPLYAAFPLQPKKKKRERNRSEKQQRVQKEENPKAVYTNIAFILTITYPQGEKVVEGQSVNVATELEAALWAWETFGGVGARTRRGFGAIKLEGINNAPYTELPGADPQQVRQWIQKHLAYFIQRERYLNIPHLRKTSPFRVMRGSNEAISVWNSVIRKLQQFRQTAAREGSGRKIGRTKWPEPEAIREITGSPNRKEKKPLRKYPRAAFGLPIVFHFEGEKDMKDVTLQGAQEGDDRLASPLILRPLACQNDQFVGLALLLDGSHIPQLVLKGEQIEKPEKVRADLKEHEVKRIPLLEGEQDVLKAFLKFFGGQ